LQAGIWERSSCKWKYDDRLGASVSFSYRYLIYIFLFLLAKMIPSLVKYPVLIAVIYGAFVWTFMRYVVLNYISTIKITPIVGQEKIINTIIGA
jgi:hypothetical protein